MRGSASLGRVVVALSCAAVVASAVNGVAAGAAATRDAPTAPLGLELFVHPAHGGGWSSHAISGATAGVGAPAVAASKGGMVLIAERTGAGDVTVAEGSVSGPFTTVDLASLGAPTATGRPTAWVGPSGASSVWYRTSLGDLEVATQTARGREWTTTDVTTVTGGMPIAGNPTVVPAGATGMAGFAVTEGGGIAEFAPPTTGTLTWSQTDPTNGLAMPTGPLTGSVAVLHPAGLSAGVDFLAATSAGDLVEVSDVHPGPSIGTWHTSDLTQSGFAPSVVGAVGAIGGTPPDAAYTTWSGDVEVASVQPSGAVSVTALTRASDLSGAKGAEASVIVGPGGPSVAERSMTGDVLVASIATPASVADVSFEQHTAELVASDVGATQVGGAAVLVAADGGPIAATPLQRRIVLAATSFDQQHRGFQTTPHGSDCNPFTGSYGRGSSYGCPRGTAAEAWCSDFAQFIWQRAGIPTQGITGWAASFVTWGHAHHRVQMGTRFRARVGDAIVWGQRSPLYGTHVAIIVSARGKYIDVVSGNSGGDFPGYGVGVWRWGPFVGSTSTVSGYKVLGVVQP